MRKMNIYLTYGIPDLSPRDFIIPINQRNTFKLMILIVQNWCKHYRAPDEQSLYDPMENRMLQIKVQ